jgi:glucose/arabinose dehydrogenase
MLTVAGALAVAGVALAGCSSQASPSLSPPPSAAPATESSSWQIALAALQHVHEVAFGGDGLLLATHQGVYTVDLDGGALALTGAASFDAMGMAVTDAGVLASGHPGEVTDDVFVAPNVGLIADDGDAWRSISLSGEVDFHALTATALEGAPLLVLVASGSSGDLVGVDATGAIVREDEGSWTTIGQIEGAAAGIAVAADGSVVVVDDRGVVLSRDGGDVWQVLVPAR